jgi:3',5'-cyclic AMP phosphodiesterase CpdA
MKIIHISDLHYGRTDSKTNDLVCSILNKYSEITEKPLIIITGDLVEDGSRKTMSACKKALQILVDNGFELLICPGNHDVKKRSGFLESKKLSKRFNQVFSSLLPTGRSIFGNKNNNLLDFPIIHQFGYYFFLGLDSNKTGKKSTPGGKLGKAQLSELDKTLIWIKEENPDNKIVIYLHHHPFEYEFNSRNIITFEDMQLFDRKEFHKIIKNRVEALLFGHVHKNQRFQDEEKKYGISLINLSTQSTSIDGNLDFTEFDMDRLFNT